jgi:hypothetical protein
MISVWPPFLGVTTIAVVKVAAVFCGTVTPSFGMGGHSVGSGRGTDAGSGAIDWAIKAGRRHSEGQDGLFADFDPVLSLSSLSWRDG